MKRKSLILLLMVLPLLAGAQVCDSIKKLPKYGNDSIQCITNLSLYRESFKQWKANKYEKGQFDKSYYYWKWVFDNAPKASLYTYVDGVAIISDKINRAENDEIRNAYIDTLMMVYEQRIIFFGDKGNVRARQGLDLLKYRPGEPQKIYDLLSESVDIEGNKSKDGTIMSLMMISIDLYKKELADQSIILDNYDRLMSIVDYNIANNKKASEVEKYKNAKAGLEGAFAPYASCEHLIPLYTKKFEDNPNDEKQLQEIAYMLDKIGCTSSQLFEDVTIKYHEINPSAQSALMLGKMMFKKEQYNETIKYMQQATALEDKNNVYDAYYVMAASYRMLNNFPKAREMAYKAAENNPKNGEPYLFIGELYGQSASMCSGSTPVEKLCIYWAAVDMFVKAKNIDPSVADKANKNIGIYSQYYPSKEDIFFNGLKEGDSYQVGCWINVTTTIRGAK